MLCSIVRLTHVNPYPIPRNKFVVAPQLAREVAAGSRVYEVWKMDGARPDPSQVGLPVDAPHEYTLGETFVVRRVAGIYLQQQDAGDEGAATVVDQRCQGCQSFSAVKASVQSSASWSCLKGRGACQSRAAGSYKGNTLAHLDPRVDDRHPALLPRVQLPNKALHLRERVIHWVECEVAPAIHVINLNTMCGVGGGWGTGGAAGGTGHCDEQLHTQHPSHHAGTQAQVPTHKNTRVRRTSDQIASSGSPAAE